MDTEAADGAGVDPCLDDDVWVGETCDPDAGAEESLETIYILRKEMQNLRELIRMLKMVDETQKGCAGV